MIIKFVTVLYGYNYIFNSLTAKDKKTFFIIIFLKNFDFFFEQGSISYSHKCMLELESCILTLGSN